MTMQSLTLRVGLEARNLMIRTAHKNGASIAQLVEEFQLSARHISVYILGFNRAPRYHRLSYRQRSELIRMWKAGDSISSIAKTLKTDTSTVKRWKRRYGLASRPRGRRS